MATTLATRIQYLGFQWQSIVKVSRAANLDFLVGGLRLDFASLSVSYQQWLTRSLNDDEYQVISLGRPPSTPTLAKRDIPLWRWLAALILLSYACGEAWSLVSQHHSVPPRLWVWSQRIRLLQVRRDRRLHDNTPTQYVRVASRLGNRCEI